jgi:hypothetical protein
MNDATTAELAEPIEQTAAEDDGWEFAMVEIMGFRKHAGRCREVERFGAKLLRIDIPIKGDPVTHGWETRFYSGSSMFSYTPTDETSVMRANKPYESPHTYRLPAPDDDEIEIEDDHHEDDLPVSLTPPDFRPGSPEDEEPF